MKKFFIDAKKYVDATGSNIAKAEELSQKYPLLVKLREDIAKQKGEYGKYVNLISETEKITLEIDAIRQKMDQEYDKFISNVSDYYDIQKNTADTELENGKHDKLHERLQNMKWTSEIQRIGTSIHKTVMEAQIKRSDNMSDAVLADFSKIEEILSSIEKITRDPQNIARLEEVQKITNAYKSSFTSFLTVWKKRTELNAVRGQVANEVLRLVDETAQTGIERTKGIAEEAVLLLSNASTVLIVGVAIGIALGVVASVLLTRAITKPLFKGVELARAMAEGDLTRTVDVSQKDEIGMLADALNEMTGNLRQMMGSISTEVSGMGSASVSLAGIAEQMTGGASIAVQRSSQVAAAAEEMSANQNSVAAAMEQASVNVNTVATAAEEMSATIGEIAANSGKAKTITDQAVRQAAQASTRVHDLGIAANEINKVTETITAISSQTNLLALNATIEAARAGDAGRGFAVVANEIKELAQQTAHATEEIRAKIQGIQQATKLTVGEIGEISTVIGEVDAIVATIAAAVEEQSVTTREIADNVGQASMGISEVNANVAQSSTVAAEIASDIADVTKQANETMLASEQVKLSATGLSDTASNLKSFVSRFKLSA